MVRQVAKGVKLYETPIKAIRKNCLDCCCGSVKEVRLCPIVSCACYPYRFGRRPDKETIDTIKEFYGENDELAGEFSPRKGNEWSHGKGG